MADGTSLESLETGDIANSADAARMAEIMRDINASGPGVGGGLPDTPQTMNMPLAPAGPMRASGNSVRQAPPPQYTPVEDEYRPRRKNFWGSFTEKLRDPLIVSILIFVLSLPILHTQIAKIAPWAYSVGGQLSWIGLAAVSVLGGVLFGVSQGVLSFF